MKGANADTLIQWRKAVFPLYFIIVVTIVIVIIIIIIIKIIIVITFIIISPLKYLPSFSPSSHALRAQSRFKCGATLAQQTCGNTTFLRISNGQRTVTRRWKCSSATNMSALG